MKYVVRAVAWPDPCRRGNRGRKRPASLAAMVRDYVHRHQPKTTRELHYFRTIPNLDEAITEAGLARRPDGKRWSHQRRIPAVALATATRRLHQAALGEARSFGDLIARVSAAVRPVRGIGELYIYDTALRLGGHLRLLPRDVYLHAGPRRGARALGLDYRSPTVPIAQLPAGNSDALRAAANSAGLVFDSSMTEKEAYSHTTRIRVLVPRILAAYASLGDHDQLSVAALRGPVSWRHGRDAAVPRLP